MAIRTVPGPAELDAFLAAYDLGSLRASRGIEAGTVNTSFALDLGGERWFLRMYEEQGPEGAAREAELLAHLAAAGVPTPTPAVGRDGQRTRMLAGKPAALFPWVDGEMVCTRAVTRSHAHAVGVALATVHRAGRPPGTALGPGRFHPEALVARSARIGASSDPEARPMEAPLAAAVRQAGERRAARRDKPVGLVHGDQFRDNVLWERGSIAALLDFESAHEGPFVFDLAVTILSWSYRDAFELSVARGISQGYREVRELEDVEREAFLDEALFACDRFTLTRITDDALRVGKRWQRFVARREALMALGTAGVREAFGL